MFAYAFGSEHQYEGFGSWKVKHHFTWLWNSHYKAIVIITVNINYFTSLFIGLLALLPALHSGIIHDDGNFVHHYHLCM